MATFKIDDHRMILIRNHEISDGEKGVSSAFGENYELVNQLKDSDFYDKGVNSVPADGGTTTIVYNTKTQKIEKEYLSLAGTLRNCAGGATPWNTWLTCEEIILNKGGKFEKDHGSGSCRSN